MPTDCASQIWKTSVTPSSRPIWPGMSYRNPRTKSLKPSTRPFCKCGRRSKTPLINFWPPSLFMTCPGYHDLNVCDYRWPFNRKNGDTFYDQPQPRHSSSANHLNANSDLLRLPALPGSAAPTESAGATATAIPDRSRSFPRRAYCPVHHPGAGTRAGPANIDAWPYTLDRVFRLATRASLNSHLFRPMFDLN